MKRSVAMAKTTGNARLAIRVSQGNIPKHSVSQIVIRSARVATPSLIVGISNALVTGILIQSATNVMTEISIWTIIKKGVSHGASALEDSFNQWNLLQRRTESAKITRRVLTKIIWQRQEITKLTTNGRHAEKNVVGQITRSNHAQRHMIENVRRAHQLKIAIHISSFALGKITLLANNVMNIFIGMANTINVSSAKCAHQAQKYLESAGRK